MSDSAIELMEELLELPRPWRVTDVWTETPGDLKEVHIRIVLPPLSKWMCPACGSECSVYDHIKDRTWRSTDSMSHPTYIHSVIPRLDCKRCGKVVTAEVPWARHGARFTLQMESLILALVQEESKSVVASQLRISYKTVNAVVKRYAKRIRDSADMSGVKRVGVDERSFDAKKFITVFRDMDAKKVVFAVPGKDSSAIGAFADHLESHGGNRRDITDFSTDFGKAYIAGIRKHFKRARITVDRFHLVRLANDALSRVKYKTIGFTVNRMRINYALLSKRENLPADRVLLVDAILGQNPDLDRAYRMRDSLCAAYSFGTKEECTPIS